MIRIFLCGKTQRKTKQQKHKFRGAAATVRLLVTVISKNDNFQHDQ